MFPATNFFYLIQLILMGANDSMEKEWHIHPDHPTAIPKEAQPNAHVPLDKFKQNLKDLINHSLVKAHDPKIIVVTPPPTDAYRVVERNFLQKNDATIRRDASTNAQYAKATKEVAEAELGDRGVVVDLWTAFMEAARATENERAKDPNFINSEFKTKDGVLLGSLELKQSNRGLVDLLHDGTHFTGKGYKIFYDELIKAIDGKWPEDLPDKMRMPIPEWKDPKWKGTKGLMEG